jgi:hypothetical protein
MSHREGFSKQIGKDHKAYSRDADSGLIGISKRGTASVSVSVRQLVSMGKSISKHREPRGSPSE